MKDVNLLVSNGVNVTESLKIFGDMETYDDTLEVFLSEIGRKVSSMSEYKETGDMANYAIIVHSLKSDAKYFGFDKLAEMALGHEMESKAGKVQYVNDHYEELITEVNKIITLVKQYLIIEPDVEESEETPSQLDVTYNKKTILIVDDSDIVRSVIEKIFKEEFDLLQAVDGQEAINIISENKNIDAMLLDLNMPNVDGFGVLDFLKANNLFVKIPVSIITGNDETETDKKAFEYPIIDILKKPFNELSLKNVIERTINHKK